jgi:hypothetical protein
MSRGHHYTDTFGSNTEKRSQAAKNSRRRPSLDDGTGDEVPLQPLGLNGIGPYKSGAGVSTKAWHPDEDDRELYLGRGPPNSTIMVTKTSDVVRK